MAAAGTLLSGWLLVQKLTGQIRYLVGCGEGSGCAQVLGSRWSQLFFVPVSLFAVVLYAGVIVLSVAGMKESPRRHLATAATVCLIGAAAWFLAVQVFVVGALCPWCLSAHAIGMATGALLLLWRPPETRGGEEIQWGVLAGVLAVTLFVTAQLIGPVPDTHAITREQPSERLEVGKDSIYTRGPGRVVSLLDGVRAYNRSALPHLGDEAAPHVLVKFFDFTCDTCRTMHRHLELVQRRHPGKFCVIMLPAPLHRRCNPHVPAGVHNHVHACELARLSLATWRAEPADFEQVVDVLFERPVLKPEEARRKVEQIIPAKKLQAVLDDPWIDELLAANAQQFRELAGKQKAMPKLIIGAKDRVMHGITSSGDTFLRYIERSYSLPRSD